MEDASETAPIREDLIATAITFLQNPKVMQSPLSQKRAFLEKKGLTKEEVDLAISRAGVAEMTPVNPQGGVQGPAVGQVGTPMLPPPVPVSRWDQFRDYTATAIVVGGFSYGLYMIYKKYLMPFIYGPTQEQKQLVAIETMVTELKTSIKETLSTVIEMQSSIKTQQQQLENGISKQKKDSQEYFANDVKDEIRSLKGLLLNRKQFPATPITQPVLPAWQLSTPKSESAEPSTNDPVPSNNDPPVRTSSEIAVPTPSVAANVTEVVEDTLDLEDGETSELSAMMNGHDESQNMPNDIVPEIQVTSPSFIENDSPEVVKKKNPIGNEDPSSKEMPIVSSPELFKEQESS